MSIAFEKLVELFGAEAVGTFAAATGRPAWLAGVPVVAPATLAAACEVLRYATRERLAVLPAGAGEHLGGLSPAGAGLGGVDFVLSARRLARVVEYEPEEMVLVAEAGVPLRALAALAAPHAQRLPCDVWPGQAATLGGAVAANRAGLDRLRRGTLRDAVLGVRVVHADGSTSKTGGKVVKNVTGFDLAKLYVGSRGTLAWLAEVNLRLVPRPPAAALVVAIVERLRAEELLLGLHRSPLVPTAWLALAGEVCDAIAVPEGSVGLVARFEGNEAAVRWQVSEAVRQSGGEEWPAERADSTYEALCASIEPRTGAVSLRVASLGVGALRVLECFEGLSAWSRGGGLLAQFGTGIAQGLLPGDLTGSELRALRASLVSQGARLEVEAGPPALVQALAGDREALDPVASDLYRRTKLAYDPAGIFPPVTVGGGWL